MRYTTDHKCVSGRHPQSECQWLTLLRPCSGVNELHQALAPAQPLSSTVALRRPYTNIDFGAITAA